MDKRTFPAPWTAEKIPGGYLVKSANGITVAWVYARDDVQGTGYNRHDDIKMTTDEARRIAVNIAKLPDLLRAAKDKGT